MTIRVRFAPSPTGNLHIGGARTALYSYLFAKANKGQYILRVEDTDEERSEKAFEKAQLDDLKWLGLDHDEGPDKEGEYGPYRQSERSEIYQKYVDQLLATGKAFYCFCTDEELEKKKAIAEEKNLPPHYDGTHRNLSLAEAEKKMAAGEKAVVRFKATNKAYQLKDLVKGNVSFPADMVGDFVIVRSNGLPVYNFSCVIDDWQMGVTHVIRGDDHLNNTVRQLMIYEALEAPVPEFAHVSLLIGSDRQKLSKRHGATSVQKYREDGYLPQALNNYLALLGWSHPDEKDIFDVEEIIPLFDLNRFSKSPAMFDFAKLDYTNAQHLRALDDETLQREVSRFISKDSFFHQQDSSWKNNFIQLYKEKVSKFTEYEYYVSGLFESKIELTDELKDIFSWETTPVMRDYIKTELELLPETGFLQTDVLDKWMGNIKKELKIKGKPLFMGLRGILTGQGHGADLKILLTLTPIEVIKKRVMEQK